MRIWIQIVPIEEKHEEPKDIIHKHYIKFCKELQQTPLPSNAFRSKMKTLGPVEIDEGHSRHFPVLGKKIRVWRNIKYVEKKEDKEKE